MKKVFAREDLCINCRLCEVYCKTAHSKSKDIVTAYKEEDPAPVARISVYGDREDSVAVNCRHCEDPACVKACITGAMHKDPKTGIVSVDENKCIGCGLCTTKCEFDAIHLSRDLPEASTMRKAEDKLKGILPYALKRAIKIKLKK